MKAYIKTRRDSSEVAVAISLPDGTLGVNIVNGLLKEPLTFSTGPLSEQWKGGAHELDIPDEFADRLNKARLAMDATSEPVEFLWSNRQPPDESRIYLMILVLHPQGRLKGDTNLFLCHRKVGTATKVDSVGDALNLISEHAERPCLLVVENDLGTRSTKPGLDLIKKARAIVPTLPSILVSEDHVTHNNVQILDWLEKNRGKLFDSAYPENLMGILNNLLGE